MEGWRAWGVEGEREDAESAELAEMESENETRAKRQVDETRGVACKRLRF